MTVEDIRFPTSRDKDGSDAMNPDPDYSSAYVILHTDGPMSGHGSAFTIGRGNDVVCAAIRAHEHLVVGHTLEEFAANPAPSGATSPAIPSCAGSVPTRGPSTWDSPRS